MTTTMTIESGLTLRPYQLEVVRAVLAPRANQPHCAGYPYYIDTQADQRLAEIVVPEVPVVDALQAPGEVPMVDTLQLPAWFNLAQKAIACLGDIDPALRHWLVRRLIEQVDPEGQ